MNKIKIFVLLVLALLLTGCTGKYRININSDGKIEEKFEFTFDTSIIDTTDIDKYIDNTIKQYRSNKMYEKYTITKKTSKDKSTIYASRKYNNLEELINKSEILPIVFEKTLFNGENEIKGLVTTGQYYKDSIFNGESDGDIFDKIDIEVKSQLKFVSNNADKFDNDSNTLYWYLTDEKNQFSLDFQFNNSKRYDIIIREFIKNILPGVIIIIIAGIVAYIIFRTLKNKSNSNNKI